MFTGFHTKSQFRKFRIMWAVLCSNFVDHQSSSFCLLYFFKLLFLFCDFSVALYVWTVFHFGYVMFQRYFCFSYSSFGLMILTCMPPVSPSPPWIPRDVSGFYSYWGVAASSPAFQEIKAWIWKEKLFCFKLFNINYLYLFWR